MQSVSAYLRKLYRSNLHMPPLGKVLVENEVIQPIVDRSFSLEQAAESDRYVEDRLKQGGVVLTS